MAIRSGEPPVGDDVQRLVEFIEQVGALLDDVAESPEGLFPEELHKELASGWQEARDRFVALGESLENERPDLQAAGLVGAQLNLKLSLWQYSARTFRRAWARARRAPRGILGNVRRIGFAKTAGLFAGALGCADIVIGSLPLPGKEMAQEIKGCFEKGAEMASLAD